MSGNTSWWLSIAALAALMAERDAAVDTVERVRAVQSLLCQCEDVEGYQCELCEALAPPPPPDGQETDDG